MGADNLPVKMLMLASFVLLLCGRVSSMATVMGSVYCDQCLDGHRTMWSSPLNGAKVMVECKNSNGQVTLSKQGETDLLGMYSIKFDGSPDMQGCTAKVVSGPKGPCNIAGTASNSVTLSWKLFGLAVYAAEALSYKPAKPSSICPKSLAQPPHPLTYFQLSACPHYYWTNPQYRCYWRLTSPDWKVSSYYGEAAGKRYGANKTLWQGLQGRGELYGAILREGITSSLNALNSAKFYYNAVEVNIHLNEALKGTTKDALKWMLAFRRANNGYGGKAKCLMSVCK